MSTLSCSLPNHAAVVIEVEGLRLLCDPWFSGFAFEGGWGLKFDNPAALEAVAGCDYLWISHVHSDHLHVPTLRLILEQNPDIVAIGNRSMNFRLDKILSGIGFRNVIPLDERKPLALGDRVTITRYPATGIDNMLHLNTPDWSVVNFNDLVVPSKAVRALAAKLGRVDILMKAFNHAGKPLDHPLPSVDEMTGAVRRVFKNAIEIFDPKWVIPMASFHYYRPAESLELNDSLLAVEDLVDLDPRIVPLQVGASVRFDGGADYELQPVSAEVRSNPETVLEPSPSVPAEELCEKGDAFCQKQRRGFSLFTYLLPIMKIWVEDLGCTLGLSFRHGVTVLDVPADDYHIRAHSHALAFWFTKPSGTDSFWVGAHFAIHETLTLSLKWKFILALLTENHLDLRAMMKMVFTPSGLRFLYNRREEVGALLGGGITGVLLGRSYYHREKQG